MISRKEVEQHLKELWLKMEIFGILFFDHRGKNQQFLLDQEIAPLKRKEIIQSLKAEDYVDGPLTEKMHNLPEMWVFGKKWKHTEIYIKISPGIKNNSVVCISFHDAEYPLSYPFKKV